MRVDTKYCIGEKVYYFDSKSLALVETEIVSVEIEMVGKDVNIYYCLDLYPICDETCDIKGSVEAFLSGQEVNKGLRVIEREVFSGPKDFCDYATRVIPSVDDEYTKKDFCVELVWENGQLKEYSEQHSGDE